MVYLNHNVIKHFHEPISQTISVYSTFIITTDNQNQSMLTSLVKNHHFELMLFCESYLYYQDWKSGDFFRIKNISISQKSTPELKPKLPIQSVSHWGHCIDNHNFTTIPRKYSSSSNNYASPKVTLSSCIYVLSRSYFSPI